MEIVKCEFYVQLKPIFDNIYKPDEPSSLRAVAMTQKKPQNPESGCFVIKVCVEADKEMFAIPEVNVHLHGADAKIAVAELTSWIAKP